ncbi:putative regulatory protein, possibly two-component response regulator [Rubellimicrobium mesophilum DSM 19309]|uniref:Putative regulatory protein, possibly two-component response regulator n=1 Tax=Rubellimicrobium mesophilum DSM 19309 TaxID=442562 RepID=A0A017HN96_9RHOB|nr:winged helix-turn-helix domain-containing protein [Rubellimicrobium mesophilum]EYD75259.1 putative regulatory protein, possibly two-component response regulator [Rubellimicrobium mesophilum DSM 19309]
MDDSVEPSVIVLGGAILDMARGTLTRDGVILPLRSKSFRLLCELARNSGRVMSKDELLGTVWPGVIVSEDSLTQAIRDIRRSLGDEHQRLIRTVARRGFILVPDAADPPLAVAPVVGGVPPLWRRPHIAILPLANETGDPDRGPILDGLIEEVTNGLARFRNLTVVARHSAFAAARAGLPLSGIGARLRAAYLVDGTARLVGGQLRIALALNDAATGDVLWGDSFDAGDSGLLALQDLVPRRIVGRLFTTIEEAGYRSSLHRGPGDLTAFEHLARGKALLRSYGPGVNERALAQFAAAIEADPAFGIAYSYRALASLSLHDYGLAPQEVKLGARADAMQGVELSPDESRCHGILGYCHATLGEFDAGESAATKAVALNPYDADAQFGLAIVLVWRGDSEAALGRIEKAKEMNPLWPIYYDSLHSEALLFLGRYAESARLLLRLPTLSPRQEMRLAAAFALAGETGPARHHAARARAAQPDWDFVEMARIAYSRRSSADVQRLIDGIKAAQNLLAEG